MSDKIRAAVRDIGTLKPGDRILIKHAEFPTWRPTWATVMNVGVRFLDTPLRELTVKVRLDEHPFPEVLSPAGPMRDFGWNENHPHITWETPEVARC